MFIHVTCYKGASYVTHFKSDSEFWGGIRLILVIRHRQVLRFEHGIMRYALWQGRYAVWAAARCLMLLLRIACVVFLNLKAKEFVNGVDGRFIRRRDDDTSSVRCFLERVVNPLV
jgi:hypothetical protein